jgi:NADH:ubiquinone oxidoreductase subunit 6 (subunit J)
MNEFIYGLIVGAVGAVLVLFVVLGVMIDKSIKENKKQEKLS